MATALTGQLHRWAELRRVLQGPLFQFVVMVALAAAVWQGMFDLSGMAQTVIVVQLVASATLKAVYVGLYRGRRRPIARVEWALPVVDIACVTVPWILIGSASTPIWAIYLFHLLAYGRPGKEVPYYFTVLVMAANVGVGFYFLRDVFVLTDAIVVALIVGSMAAVAGFIGRQSRNVEARAKRLAEIDPLTGIANRRMFLGRLGEVASVEGQPYAILMLDLDNFKQLNDVFGHAHGDVVLARVARVLQDSLREGDLLARYGGEEFVALLPDTNPATAQRVGQRLRQAVADYTPTTISVGVAVKEPGESTTSVLLRADGNLLQAKRSGKNTVHADGSPPRRMRNAG